MINKSMALMLAGMAVISSGMTFALLQNANEPTLQAEGAKLSGHLTAVLYDENGNIKAYRQTDNRIVDNGLNNMADLVFNGINLVSNEAKVQLMAIGTSGTVSATTQKDLLGRSGLGSCVNQTASFSQGAVAAGTVNATTTVTFLGSGGCAATIQEAGLFWAQNSGSQNLFARQSFGGITVGSADSLQITWSIKLADDGNE